MAEPTIEDIERASEAVSGASESMSKANEEAKKTKTAFEKLSSSNVDLVREFGKLTRETDSVSKGFLDVVSAVGKTFLTLEGFNNLLNNITNQIVSNSQTLANVFEKSRADYTKATGDIISPVGNMAQVMQDASKSIDLFGTNTAQAAVAVGVAMPQLSEAYINATQGANAFGSTQKENLAFVTATTAQLELLGISATTTAQNTRLLTDSMGSSNANIKIASEETARATLALAGMNGSLTQSAALIQQNADLVLVFGTDSLVTLQGQATATGIALDTLTQVSAKFNTFEGAAEQVGKLNALLGADYLSVTEMMYAEPADQVQMIANAFKDAGVSVENMDPIQKKFMLTTIQSTLGLKSQAEAMRFLNADEFERGRLLAESQAKEEARADMQERLNNLLLSSKPILEVLINNLTALTAVLTPLFVALNEVTRVLADCAKGLKQLSDEYPILTSAVVGLVIGLGILFGVVTQIMSGFAAMIAALPTINTLLTLFGATAPVASAGAGSLAATLSAAVPAILAVGGAIALAGVGIGLMIASAAALVVAVAYLVDTLIKGGMAAGDFTIILGTFLATMGAMFTGLITFSGLVLIGLIVLIPVLSILGAVAIPASIGILILSAAFYVLSASIEAISNVLMPLIQAMTTMGQTFSSLVDAKTDMALLGVISRLVEISSLIDEISSKKLNIDVNFSGDLGLAALSVVGEKIAAAPTTPATTPTMAEKTTISINQIIVKFDDNTAFKSKVQEIIFNDGSTFKNNVAAALPRG